jgi:hypothetical protein
LTYRKLPPVPTNTPTQFDQERFNRCCVDFRNLNDTTIREAVPLPKIENLIRSPIYRPRSETIGPIYHPRSETIEAPFPYGSTYGFTSISQAEPEPMEIDNDPGYEPMEAFQHYSGEGKLSIIVENPESQEQPAETLEGPSDNSTLVTVIRAGIVRQPPQQPGPRDPRGPGPKQTHLPQKIYLDPLILGRSTAYGDRDNQSSSGSLC